jgi:hypothetical protein
MRPVHAGDVRDELSGDSIQYVSYVNLPPVVRERIERHLFAVRRPLRSAALMVGVGDLDQVTAIDIADPDSQNPRSCRRENNALSVW